MTRRRQLLCESDIDTSMAGTQAVAGGCNHTGVDLSKCQWKTGPIYGCAHFHSIAVRNSSMSHNRLLLKENNQNISVCACISDMSISLNICHKTMYVCTYPHGILRVHMNICVGVKQCCATRMQHLHLDLSVIL